MYRIAQVTFSMFFHTLSLSIKTILHAYFTSDPILSTIAAPLTLAVYTLAVAHVTTIQ